MFKVQAAAAARRGIPARRAVCALLAIAALFAVASPARTESTVECHSKRYQYDECWAGPLKKPQLIHQISSSACILNKSWGYNPKSRYIWVAEGCAGVFADVAGYHHGRGGGHDADTRAYDDRGHDTGAVVGGAVLGALVAGMAEDGRKHHGHAHTTTNYVYVDGDNDCHGVGCLVDDPDANDDIDPTPQFDAEGEPNFDEHGDYQGCHGVGCLVDDPYDDGDNG